MDRVALRFADEDRDGPRRGIGTLGLGFRCEDREQDEADKKHGAADDDETSHELHDYSPVGAAGSADWAAEKSPAMAR